MDALISFPHFEILFAKLYVMSLFRVKHMYHNFNNQAWKD